MKTFLAKLFCTRPLVGRLFAVALMVAMSAAHAAYPDRPIIIVVPSNPGPGMDSVARRVARILENKLGATVVVENRPGASATIGETRVARALPDGYTLLFDATPFSINPSTMLKNPTKLADFIPISNVSLTPNMLVVPADSPSKTVQEFVQRARANPGKLTYGSGGSGTVQRMSAELFRLSLNLDMLHVPYRSGPEATQGLVGGQVDSTFTTIASNYPLVKAGKLRALAVTSEQRSPLMPDVPTLSEAAIPGYITYEWNGLLAPAKTPADIILKLQTAVMEGIKEQEVQDWIAQRGAIAIGSSSKDFTEFLRREEAKWADVVKRAGIGAE